MPNPPSSIVSPGEKPSFAMLTPPDHSEWIIISAALGLAMILLFGGIRIFIRSTLGHGYGQDDIFILASTVVAIVQNSLILGATASGLGKSIDVIPSDLHEQVQIMYYASNQLYGAALGLSKTSLLWFLFRLTPIAAHQRIIKGMMALLGAWQIAFAFSTAIVCQLPSPWILIGAKCNGWFLRWEILEPLGLTFEVAAFGMAIWLAWNLKTDFANKVAVVSTFSFRLVVIIFVGFRLASFPPTGFSTNPTLVLAAFIAWTSAEMNYSIVAATIPTLRPLVVNLITHYDSGQMHSHENSNADGLLEPLSQRCGTEGNSEGSAKRDSMTAVKANKRESLQSAKRDSMQSSKRNSSHNPDGSFRGTTSSEVIGNGQADTRRISLSVRQGDKESKARDADLGLQSLGDDQSGIRKDVKIEVQHGGEEV